MFSLENFIKLFLSESQFMIYKVIGLKRFALKPYFKTKKLIYFIITNYFNKKQWDADDFKSNIGKSKLSGNWFKVSDQNEDLQKEFILARAEAARKMIFFVNNEFIDFGSSPSNGQWNIDPISGKKWPDSSIFLNLSDLPADIRYPWELGRLHQLIWFGQAWKLTNDKKWIEEACDQINSLLSQSPIYFGIQWRDGLQLAIRIYSMIAFIDLCHDADDEVHDLITSAVNLHSKVLKKSISNNSEITNNHVIGEACGLALAGLYLDNKSLYNSSMSRLDIELKRQIYPDGIPYEGSIPYIRFNLDFLTFLYKAIDSLNNKAPLFLEKAIIKIACGLSKIVDKDGFIPPIGDGDDGRVLKIDDEPYLCVNESLLFAGALTNKNYGVKPSQTSFLPWVIGKKINKFNYPKQISFLKNSGIIHIHIDKLDIWIDGGPTGLGIDGPGGHGHNDTTSLVVHLDNKGILHDPGWYSYFSDIELRNKFRSTFKHNTISINNLEQAELMSAFEIKNECKPTILKIRETDNLISIMCGHNGYDKINLGIRYIRFIHILKKQKYKIYTSDHIKSLEPIKITSFLGSDFEFTDYNNNLYKLDHSHILKLKNKYSDLKISKETYSRANKQLKDGSSISWLISDKAKYDFGYKYCSRFELEIKQ